MPAEHVVPRLLHHLLDERAAATPDAPALTTADGTLTYREAHDTSLRLAGWLTARGVRPRDRVVIAMPTTIDVPPLLHAASRVGAAFCVLHEQVRGNGLTHVLDDLEPSLLITADEEASTQAHRRGIPVAMAADLRTAAATAEPVALPEPSPDDIVCLSYTSGSTALPKAVISEHRQMVFAATAIHHEIGYGPGDVVFCPLPLSFDYGLYQLFLAALGGAHLWLGSVVQGGPGLLKALVDADATVLTATPAMTETLVWLLERTTVVPQRLRLLTTTGAAMKHHTAAALRAALPALRLQIMYGLTECKRVSIMPPDEDLTRPGASGRPLPGTEVHVQGPTGERLAVGETGEFVVRGPHVMPGYWRREDLTADRFPLASDGTRELHTGDYGRMDEDGYLYVDGRRDDIYKERGFRVSTTEVEAAAQTVPGVRLAAVIPPRDAPGSSAVLVVTGDVRPRAVLGALRSRIEPYKVPQECVVVDEIPLSGNGKLARAALADMLANRTVPAAEIH
ncbi:class I adenylate-forming enzyme family protein [Saccharothrix sp. NRRL B-16314]|uniref:class I adenylate-forming enzyme family protein n=1 Tax=Saccharothrix sp. NRRL B-16314 TaxID=1463825 RepID=UPI000A82B32B|nr:class I adenylate-forming enzyme family protein [Saccharothrix sp. NRRL B-16314]